MRVKITLFQDAAIARQKKNWRFIGAGAMLGQAVLTAAHLKSRYVAPGTKRAVPID